MTKYLAYCQGDILLTKEGNIPFDLGDIRQNPWNSITSIKVMGVTYKIVRLDTPVVDSTALQMINLRKSFDILSKDDYQIAGKGAELLYWDLNSKFCGCCGAPMVWTGEICKKCTNCGKELWPQLATAIIVRVVRQTNQGEEILLVHARNFKGKYYGLIAGFVETGESLEECVMREVWEETHIHITNIRYFGSQPWPFPCGLMIGFTAEYLDGDLCLQKSELDSGGWFSQYNLPEIPNRASLARLLIDDWLLQEK